MDRLLEYAGSGLSLAGAYLLAWGHADGWLVFLIANGLLAGFALKRRHFGLLAMYLAFVPSSVMGILKGFGG